MSDVDLNYVSTNKSFDENKSMVVINSRQTDVVDVNL